MRKADGQIRLHSYTRGTSLNYRTQVGPIETMNADGLPLKGTVTIEGTNGYNVVRVEAKSGMPLAEILRIGGFTGDYVTDKVIGDTTGNLEFRFPRAMTNNYEVLNGGGHVTVENGHLMRLNLFAGLTKILADHVPGVRQLVDQSRASVDYRIENGIIRTDNSLLLEFLERRVQCRGHRQRMGCAISVTESRRRLVRKRQQDGPLRL